MRTRRLLRVALALAALGLGGCFRMTIKSGLPTGATPIEYDNKWHSGVIYGIAELSGPYFLDKACPQGWSEIHTETSFPNALVQILTWQIYSPQSVTIRCAAPSGRGASNP